MRRSLRHGFTLIEILIVTVILGILMIIAASSYGLQHQRALDARRKSDLAKIKIAFEDYYNDKRCYPTAAMMSHCNLNDLQPYLAKVPCDPGTKQPYAYVADAACTYYAVLTTIQDTHDPIIAALGCSPTCAPGKPYNYGITNGGSSLSSLALQVSIPGGGSPTPTPTPSNGVGNQSALACTPSGQCNVYGNPAQSGCPITYTNPVTCQQGCSNPANRCAQ